jgi:hypothetical protein
MAQKFYRCSCFFTDNIFLSKLKTHIRYTSKEQFCDEYRDLLKGLNEADKNEIFYEVFKEQQRRSNLDGDSIKRRDIIKTQYAPKHPEIFNFKVNQTYFLVKKIYSFNHSTVLRMTF